MLMTVVLVVCAILLLAYFNYQKKHRRLQELKSKGFVVSENLQGEPSILYDEKQHHLALLTGSGYQVLPVSSLISSEVLYDLDKRGEKNYRIELVFNSSEVPNKQVVLYHDEFLAERMHQRLRAIREQTSR